MTRAREIAGDIICARLGDKIDGFVIRSSSLSKLSGAGVSGLFIVSPVNWRLLGIFDRMNGRLMGCSSFSSDACMLDAG